MYPEQASGVTHTNGATRLLLSRGFAKPRDDFDKLLMLTLRGPVVETPPRIFNQPSFELTLKKKGIRSVAHR